MKKLLSSKILAIAICVIMLFTTLIFCISFMIVQKSTPVSMQHNIPENPIAGSVEEINTLSSTTYNSNATICYHEDFAINRIKNIVKTRGSGITQISVNRSEYAYFAPKNISQIEFNDKFNAKYGLNIKNTCSLIAIEIMTDVIMQISDFVDMKYPNYSTEELQLTIIKELYDIAVSFGNDCSTTNPKAGTYINTIQRIIEKYFANHNYEFPVSYDVIDSKGGFTYLREYLVDKAFAPAILTTNNLYLESIFQGSGNHSFVIVGGYHYTVKYKKISNLFKTLTCDFYAIVICDGWKHYNVNDTIGSNLQLLVIEDDAQKFYLNNIDEWMQ